MTDKIKITDQETKALNEVCVIMNQADIFEKQYEQKREPLSSSISECKAMLMKFMKENQGKCAKMELKTEDGDETLYMKLKAKVTETCITETVLRRVIDSLTEDDFKQLITSSAGGNVKLNDAVMTILLEKFKTLVTNVKNDLSITKRQDKKTGTPIVPPAPITEAFQKWQESKGKVQVAKKEAKVYRDKLDGWKKERSELLESYYTKVDAVQPPEAPKIIPFNFPKPNNTSEKQTFVLKKKQVVKYVPVKLKQCPKLLSTIPDLLAVHCPKETELTPATIKVICSMDFKGILLQKLKENFEKLRKGQAQVKDELALQKKKERKAQNMEGGD